MKLNEEARGAIMPNISGLDAAKANALLVLIENESKLAKSEFIGLNLTHQTFTANHVATGRRIFEGTQPLTNSGAGCLSCHAVDGLGTLGGGWLAPLVAYLETAARKPTVNGDISALSFFFMGLGGAGERPPQVGDAIPAARVLDRVEQRSHGQFVRIAAPPR